MRIGPSHQAGSDSLLTSSTFFKMREIYFEDQIDDAEYSGKLYGLGQTFSLTNGLNDPGRGGATLAERDDRGSSSARDAHNQTPGPNSATGPQTPGVLNLGPMQGGPLQSGMNQGSYGPLGANGPYIRTPMVGGR